MAVYSIPIRIVTDGVNKTGHEVQIELVQAIRIKTWTHKFQIDKQIADS